MQRSLFDYMNRCIAVLPAAVEFLQSHTEAGFIERSCSLLEIAVAHLERNAKSFAPLEEEGLSAVVVANLNRYGIRADNEPNSNGHVDIHIVHAFRPALAICGEAKIYDGPAYHIRGLGQVLDYTTGRCGFAFVLEYVRTLSVADAISKIREQLDAKLPENQQGQAKYHGRIRFALTTRHNHRVGRVVEVLHLGVNMIPHS